MCHKLYDYTKYNNYIRYKAKIECITLKLNYIAAYSTELLPVSEIANFESKLIASVQTF